MGHRRVIQHTVMPARSQSALEATPFHHYVSDDGTVWTEFYRLGNDYLLRFPDLADFEVSENGTTVVAHPADGTDAATIEHLYINQLVPLAMSRQGRPAYHASVVTVPGGAVAFLGKTGAGKSTLAASFALDEAEFLTDDALLVEETSSGCRVLPSHASLRLWEDSVAALIHAENSQAEPISYSSKARLLAGDALAYCAEPQPLLAAYLLERQDAKNVAIRALTGLNRYMAWLGNSFLLDIEDQQLLAKHLDWTHRISGAVPTFVLDYPRDYGMLPDVQNAVRKHVANAGN
jgi:hypothetical protein